MLSILLGFVAGFLTFLVGRWLARVLTRYATRSMEKAHLDPMVIRFLKTVIFIGVMGAVIIAALSQAGIHTTSLTALLASAGVAIGLALKDLLSNLVANIGYGDDIGVARDLLMGMVTSHPLVLSSPAPTVEVLELAESSVNLAVRPWGLTENYGQARSDLLEQMKLRLGESRIDIPYPQQVVHVHQPACGRRKCA